MLFTAILCGLLLIFPLATGELITPSDVKVVGVADGFQYTVWGIEYLNGGSEVFYYHAILVIVSMLLPLATIYLYKKRAIQLRLCVVEGVLLLGLIGFEFIGIYRLNAMFSGTPFIIDHSYVVTAPIAALVTTFMAYKGVLRDIILLRSTDRIR